MEPVTIIEATEDESCCYCDLCYATEFGSRCRNKHDGYGDAMDIMRHMTQLEHLRMKSGAKP